MRFKLVKQYKRRLRAENFEARKFKRKLGQQRFMFLLKNQNTKNDLTYTYCVDLVEDIIRHQSTENCLALGWHIKIIGNY